MRFEEITCTDSLHATNPCPIYPFSISMSVGSNRPIIGADGTVGGIISSDPAAVSPTGQTFMGPSSSYLSVSLRRVSPIPRYVISLYNKRGVQIGDTLLGLGSLDALKGVISSDIVLGSMIKFRVLNDTNQAYDPDNAFSASRMMRWG